MLEDLEKPRLREMNRLYRGDVTVSQKIRIERFLHDFYRTNNLTLLMLKVSPDYKDDN